MCRTFITRRAPRKFATDMLDSEMIRTDEENGCRFKGKERKPDTLVTCVVAVRERLLGFYSDKTTQFINMLWHWR